MPSAQQKVRTSRLRAQAVGEEHFWIGVNCVGVMIMSTPVCSKYMFQNSGVKVWYTPQ